MDLRSFFLPRRMQHRIALTASEVQDTDLQAMLPSEFKLRNHALFQRTPPDLDRAYPLIHNASDAPWAPNETRPATTMSRIQHGLKIMRLKLFSMEFQEHMRYNQHELRKVQGTPIGVKVPNWNRLPLSKTIELPKPGVKTSDEKVSAISQISVSEESAKLFSAIDSTASRLDRSIRFLESMAQLRPLIPDRLAESHPLLAGYARIANSRFSPDFKETALKLFINEIRNDPQFENAANQGKWFNDNPKDYSELACWSDLKSYDFILRN